MLRVPAVVVLDHADPAQAALIVALQRASYAVEAELIGFDGIPPLHEPADAVRVLDLTILAGVDGGELAGLLGYRRHREVVDVDRLAVHPTSFRQGVGRSLVNELHRREVTATSFEVSTASANEPAISLYLQTGYRRQREEVVAGLPIVHLLRSPG
jgi:ribosomal protein S18 acetylase RimI-like enzyme